MTNLIPRLTNSKTWTDVPPEFLAKVVTVFNNQFEIEASHGEFIADGRIYPQELVLRIGYLEKGRLKQINFEASMDIKTTVAGEESGEDAEQKAPSTMDRLYTCIDALGSVMEEYFDMGEEDEMLVPLRWGEFDFEGETVYMQHSTINTRLEEEADRILGLLADDLVQEDTPSDDALANAEVDSELAAEIQKAIRSGQYRLNSEPTEDDPKM